MNLKQFEVLEKANDARVDALFNNWDWSAGCPPLPKDDLHSLGMQLFNARMMGNKDDIKTIKREIRAYKRENNIGFLGWLARNKI